MTVAFVAGQLSLGGAERQTAIMVRALDAAGDRACVACLSDRDEPYGRELRALGIEVLLLPRRGSWDLARLVALRRWLALRRPDVICAVGEFAAAYTHYALVGVRDRPRLVALLRRGAGRLPWLKRAVVSHALRRADQVHANSETGREYAVSRLGLRRESVGILPNAIPDEVFRFEVDRDVVRAGLGVDPGETLVLYVGRDAYAKDIPTLVEALRLLHETGRPFRALVVGPGLASPPDGVPDPGPRVRWLGARDDVLSLMVAADIVLLTSRSEGTPNVVLEAMAVGRPVVATSAGDVPRLLGEAGRTAPVGDAPGLRDALVALMDSPEARRRAGEIGARRARSEFSTGRTLASLKDALGGVPLPERNRS